MTAFSPDARVAVRPFARRHEGDQVTIGDVRREIYLTIPADGVELLDALAGGATVGEAAERYARAHGETPDLDDFLQALAAEGFVAPHDGREDPVTDAAAAPPALGRISSRAARACFGAVAWCVYAVLIGAGIAAVAADPHVVPGPQALVFHAHIALMALALIAAAAAGLYLHELAHLLAARACGVPARIRPGRRLWFIVAETDMTGIWLASKRQRHLAFLAGPLADVVSAAVLVVVLWAQRRGWIGLTPALTGLTAAVLFSCLMRLVWQCFFFVRTDLYYVVATALDCKRLMDDTEDLLRNAWARLRGRVPPVDQSSIPAHERRATRGYAAVWIAGRVVAYASLLGFTLPLLAGYGVQLIRVATGGHSRYGTFDLATIVVFGLGLQGAGVALWIRGLNRRRTQRSTDALAHA